MIVYYILLLVNIGLSVLGQFLIKFGVNKVDEPISVASATSYILNPYIIGGIMSYCVGMVLWILILSKMKLSVAYPALSLGYILVIIISWKFLGEPLTFFKVVGSAFIILGVFLIFRYQ